MAALLAHSEAVTLKAIACAAHVAHLKPDLRFIREAAMLHDIGIIECDAPQLGCHGPHPYICHGYLGAEMLRAEGYARHAVVCETHVGVGLTAAEIIEKGFPIPARDMLPQGIEEVIICFADKFFSKDDRPEQEKPLWLIREVIDRFGPGKLDIFDKWCLMFGGPTGPS